MKQVLRQNRQFLLYCMIGLGAAALDMGIFTLVIRSGTFKFEGANAAGYASGTLLSFTLNARYNFRLSDRLGLRLASFSGVAALGLTVSSVLLYFLIALCHVNQFLAKFVSMVVIVGLQYNLNRMISFRKAS